MNPKVKAAFATRANRIELAELAHRRTSEEGA